MSLPLRDLRTKVSIDTDCALEARARILGKDKAEVARDVLHAWALQEIRAARVVDALLKANNCNGADEG